MSSSPASNVHCVKISPTPDASPGSHDAARPPGGLPGRATSTYASVALLKNTPTVRRGPCACMNGILAYSEKGSPVS